jgi:hypothetical protein
VKICHFITTKVGCNVELLNDGCMGKRLQCVHRMNGMLIFRKTGENLWSSANAILRRKCNESAEGSRETS